MLRSESRAILGESHKPIDFIRELSDVARPSIYQQVLHRVLRYRKVGLVMVLAMSPQKMLGEEGNFLATLTKRRDCEPNDIQSVKQVFSKSTLRNEPLQICIS